MIVPGFSLGGEEPFHLQPELDVVGRDFLNAKKFVGMELDIKPGDAVKGGLGEVQVVSP